jgi:hypothetical protein
MAGIFFIACYTTISACKQCTTLINSGHLVKVQDETGDAVRQSGAGSWLNDIGNWGNRKATR